MKVQNQNSNWERELNAEQLRVVREADGPCLVLAGAGSGKTRTITYRVAHLLDSGVAPSSILLLTFTNKAANEMLERVAKLVGANGSGIWGGTFHSIANRVLRRYAALLGYSEKFVILDQEDSRDMIKLCVKNFALGASEKMFPSAAVLQNLYSFSRNSKMGIEKAVEAKYPKFYEFIPAIADISADFSKRKLESNSMDFDDLLLRLLELLQKNASVRERMARQFKYILVDEYQDTNPIQADIIDALGSVHKNILVVGDDAQSIYSFRAATVQNILDFPGRYPGAKIFKLETNYRSTPEILEVANSIILNNTNQFSKYLKPSRSAFSKPTVMPAGNPVEEAEFVAERILELREEGVAPTEVAVLFRATHHSQALEFELMKRGIPYEYRGGLKFFERGHIKDALAFLRVYSNPKDEVSWMRVLSIQQGIGPTIAGRLIERLKGIVAIKNLDEIDTRDLLTVKAEAGFSEAKAIFQKLASAKDDSPTELLRAIASSSYKDYLETEYPDADERLADLEQMAVFAEGESDLAEFLRSVNLVDDFGALRAAAGGDEKGRVALSTIHQAKGLEWDTVFVIRLSDGDFPNRRALIEDGGLEEERRLFYVAATRAKRLLYLSYPFSSGFGAVSSFGASMFLDEIDGEFLEKNEIISKYGDSIIEMDDSGEFKDIPKRKPGSYLIDI